MRSKSLLPTQPRRWYRVKTQVIKSRSKVDSLFAFRFIFEDDKGKTKVNETFFVKKAENIGKKNIPGCRLSMEGYILALCSQQSPRYPNTASVGRSRVCPNCLYCPVLPSPVNVLRFPLLCSEFCRAGPIFLHLARPGQRATRQAKEDKYPLKRTPARSHPPSIPLPVIRACVHPDFGS